MILRFKQNVLRVTAAHINMNFFAGIISLKQHKIASTADS